MDGIEILNVSSTLLESNMLYYCIYIVVIFVIIGIILIIKNITTVTMTYTLICVLCFLATFNLSKASHTIITIKVTGRTDMKAFYDTYEVLSYEKDIYKVKEREK